MILNGLFTDSGGNLSELTVLGFISLLTFLFKTSVLESISVRIFGESGSSILPELVERIHMALFFMTVFFLGHVRVGNLTRTKCLFVPDKKRKVLVLVRLSFKLDQLWSSWEKDFRKDPSVAEGELRSLNFFVSLLFEVLPFTNIYRFLPRSLPQSTKK